MDDVRCAKQLETLWQAPKRQRSKGLRRTFPYRMAGHFSAGIPKQLTFDMAARERSFVRYVTNPTETAALPQRFTRPRVEGKATHNEQCYKSMGGILKIMSGLGNIQSVQNDHNACC